jgi:drug/metabolite transporter (DMT)-like permease
VNVFWYVLLCAIWGSTWLVIKVGYGGLGPFNVAALRFFIAGTAFALVVAATGSRWPRGRTEWLLVVWVGVMMFAADYGLIYWAEQFIDSGLTAILFATLPLITIAFAHAYLPDEPLTARKFLGTAVAFAGVVSLFADGVRLDASRTVPMLAIVASAVFAALASVASKRHGHDISPAALNAPAMLVGAMVLTVVSFAVGDGFRFPADAATWTAVLYLSIAGSVVTFLVFFSLLKIWSATTMSFISVFTPATALLLGFVFLDERPTLYTALGAVLILAGVTLALTGPGGER